MEASDKVFAGSIPSVYDAYLVPLIFEPYAADLAARYRAKPVARVLEVAAGTGVVTRALAATLTGGGSLVATDLNQAMIDQAASSVASPSVEWRRADAQALPFGDETFDLVVCQFGVMFFPDKPKAYAEARRVLRPGGRYVFSVWDRIEDNEFADDVEKGVATLYADAPPRFLSRAPYGYFDRETIRAELSAGGFASNVEIDVVTARSRAASPRHPAIGFCQGSPLRSEIESRDPSGLERATDAATDAVAARFGFGAVDAKVQALVVTAER